MVPVKTVCGLGRAIFLLRVKLAILFHFLPWMIPLSWVGPVRRTGRSIHPYLLKRPDVSAKRPYLDCAPHPRLRSYPGKDLATPTRE